LQAIFMRKFQEEIGFYLWKNILLENYN